MTVLNNTKIADTEGVTIEKKNFTTRFFWHYLLSVDCRTYVKGFMPVMKGVYAKYAKGFMTLYQKIFIRGKIFLPR